MDHFIVGYYVVALMIGVVNMTLGMVAYINYQIRFLATAVISMLSLSSIVFFQGLSAYAEANGLSIEMTRSVARIGSWIAMICMMYFLPLLVHQLFEMHTWKDRRLIIGFLALFSLVLLVLNTMKFNRLWLNGSMILFYGSMAYYVGVIIHNRKALRNVHKQRVLLSYIVLSIVFLPLIVLDVKSAELFTDITVVRYGFMALPTFYIALNVLTIFWVMTLSKKMPELFRMSVDRKDMVEMFFDKYSITEREKDVVQMLINGYSYENIAESLIISKSTVKTHIRNVYRKVEVNNKVELMNTIYES